MSKVRLFINYETTDKPWGGSNSFLSALRSYLSGLEDIAVVPGENDDFDVMLLNTAYSAPGRYLSLRKIKNYHRSGYPGLAGYFLNGFRKRAVKTVLRLDGLRRFYADAPNVEGDRIQLSMVEFVDAIIFQSNESMRQFQKIKGDMPVQSFVVPNGVNQKIFNMDGKAFWNGKDRINIFATSWSANLRKGFEDMARLSEIDGITVNFAGNWPKEIGPAKVLLRPPVPQALLAAEYKKNDVFFFPSRNEACPNVVFEALSCGLPVIYHPSGGTPEIASGYGVEMKDDLNSSISDIARNYNSCLERIKRDRALFSIDYAGHRYAEVFRKVSHNV